MVKAGKMRHLISLQRRSTTQDAMGQPTETFTTIADVVCQIQSTIGREFLRASGEVSVGSHVVHTRARDDITHARATTSHCTPMTEFCLVRAFLTSRVYPI